MSIYAKLILMGAEDLVGGGDAPDGPPTSATKYLYDTDKYGLQWTTGDSDAETEIYLFDGACSETLITTLGAGVVEYETGTTTKCLWMARHKKNGQYSAEVHFISGAGPDCPACPDAF